MHVLELNEQAVFRLQAEINNELNVRQASTVLRIELDNGSEVTDLRANAKLRVFTEGRDKHRLFTVITLWCLTNFLTQDLDDHPRPDARGIYTSGGPWIVVREITGSAVVRGILYYLDMEEGRGGV